MPISDTINRFEAAVRANGYRTGDDATEREYQAAKEDLAAALSASPSDAERHKRVIPDLSFLHTMSVEELEAVVYSLTTEQFNTLRRFLYPVAPPPPAAVQEPVALKALEWKESASDTLCRSYRSHPYGGYHIYERDTNGIGRIRYFTSPIKARAEYLTFDEAAASVQADYEQRIRSALSTSQIDPAPEIDWKKLFLESAEARDTIGFIGSVPECIASLDAEIAALRAENDRLRETKKMDWRFIDTAPKDGTSVLIWVDGHMIEASFDSDSCQWIAGAWGLGFGKDATYWAQLPSTPLQTNGQAPQMAALPQDVINLVIAAREAFDTCFLEDQEINALDKALEAFSSRVPYENEPDAVAPEQEGAGE